MHEQIIRVQELMDVSAPYLGYLSGPGVARVPNAVVMAARRRLVVALLLIPAAERVVHLLARVLVEDSDKTLLVGTRVMEVAFRQGVPCVLARRVGIVVGGILGGAGAVLHRGRGHRRLHGGSVIRQMYDFV